VPQVAVADIDVYYESHGSGPPLLLLCGMAQAVADLQPLIAALAQQHTVIAMDNRGAGGTSAPPGPYSIDQMAGDLIGLMDTLGISRASVLGISMGGRIALALALAHPDRVERLVLVSTSARVTDRRRMKALMLIGLLPGLRPANSLAPHAMRAQFDASTRYNCVARLDRIAQPALVVHGRGDVIVPLELGEEMHRGITGAQLVLLDGGHRITLEPQPRAEICAAVLPFLAPPE
jgi:pimeloyl-ACP methyl ester carboxylesterase